MSDYKRDAAQVAGAQLDKSKPYKPKTVEAGANVFNQKSTKKFKDTLKTRADDPRNWEFYYADSAAPEDPWSPRRTMGPRALAAADRKQLALAKSKAAEGGQDLYRTMEIEFETTNIKSETKEQKAKFLASTPGAGGAAAGGGAFRSSRVATNLAAQKQQATRRTSGRARGGSARRVVTPTEDRSRSRRVTTSPFGAPSKRRTMRIS